MHERRIAFRELVLGDASSKITLTDDDRVAFRSSFRDDFDRVKNLFSKGKANEESLKEQFFTMMLARLETIVSNNWNLIEPAQIILRKSRRIDQTKKTIEPDVARMQLLTAMADVGRYVRADQSAEPAGGSD